MLPPAQTEHHPLQINISLNLAPPKNPLHSLNIRAKLLCSTEEKIGVLSLSKWLEILVIAFFSPIDVARILKFLHESPLMDY